MTTEVFRVVGKPLPRQDSASKVTGSARYAADLQFGGLLHGKVLRSPHAHARIVRLDVSRAEAAPGVRAVATATDVRWEGIDRAARAHVVFAQRETWYFGQPVAAVAADSAEDAEAAIALIDVEYEVLPALVDVEHAMRPHAAAVRPDLRGADSEDREGHISLDLGKAEVDGSSKESPNVVNKLRFRRGDVDRGFAEADLVVEGRFDCGMVHQCPLEPQVVVADYHASGKLTLYAPTQAQFLQRDEVAAILGMPASDVKMVSTEIGGGFGARVAPLVHPIAAILSKKAGRPVRVLLSRREELAAGVPAQRMITTAKIGARRDGTLTTIQAEVIFDAGCFPSGLGLASIMVAACYRFEHLDVDSLKVLTHKVSTGAYRAPGAPEVAFAVEQLVDEVALKLGMDPLALRRMNASREGDLMPNGKPWGRIGLIECIDAIAESEVWRTREQRSGPNRGVGVAIGGWLGSFQPATVLVRLGEEGRARVILGSNDISGTNTSFAQLAAEELGLPLDLVEATTGDTDSAPYAGMVTGSKSTYSFGPSVIAAARDARSQILAIAASELDVSTEDLRCEGGEVRSAATGASISLARIAALTSVTSGRYAPVLGRGSEVVRTPAPGFTAQVVDISVDPATGTATVHAAAAVQDSGTAINPLSVLGQLDGGLAQGIAMGLSEELVFSPEGRLLSGSLLDYRLLTAMDLPHLESRLVEVPSAEGPHGARVVGEPPIIPGSAAVGNAVRRAIGARVMRSPLTPERIAAARPA